MNYTKICVPIPYRIPHIPRPTFKSYIPGSPVGSRVEVPHLIHPTSRMSLTEVMVDNEGCSSGSNIASLGTEFYTGADKLSLTAPMRNARGEEVDPNSTSMITTVTAILDCCY
jgi:hypothetical protein